MSKAKPKPLDRIDIMRALERRVLWLSHWMVHNANHIRESRDGIKVGGHQASSASISAILTALYFDVMRPEDRIAVKPHASPVMHAIKYMMGREPLERLQAFRGLGGAQSYPSRTKDVCEVDFSTGSVGLGVAVTLFASLVQDYTRLHRMGDPDRPQGRIIAVMGDAELDEGNIYEALLEGWKHDVRNLWWVIDYNRQSLDGVVNDKLFQKIKGFFAEVGWNVVILKYGLELQEAFKLPGGEALERWIDACPNDLYSALTFKGQNGEGGVWRERLLEDLKGVNGIPDLLSRYDDPSLHRLMTNLAGHDTQSISQALNGIEGDQPHCIIAYTVKGYGTPQAGHKDNHAGMMTPEQMELFRRDMGVAEGQEWDKFLDPEVSADILAEFVQNAPFNIDQSRVLDDGKIVVPAIEPPSQPKISTQMAFGQILHGLARSKEPLADRIITTSPDVTVSTNLGPWVNQRGLFARRVKEDVFRQQKVVSVQKWHKQRSGQHIELGIAENNLFLALAAMGLSEKLFGARLIPIGTLYDPFIARGLDALNYACYQDARFMVVATPSGLTLAPEGGAHQSISTPLIGMGQPGLTSFEPAYADELAAIMAWSFEHMQADDGGSVYLRLSTRQLEQPSRPLDKNAIIRGAYWLKEPTAQADLALVYTGAVAPEALEAAEAMADDIPGLGILAVTSADALYSDWRRNGTDSHVAKLLASLSPSAPLVTVMDGAPATLTWLGGVDGRRVHSLGLDQFGQSGDLPDLYRTYALDADAIIDAAARALA